MRNEIGNNSKLLSFAENKRAYIENPRTKKEPNKVVDYKINVQNSLAPHYKKFNQLENEKGKTL